MRGHKLYDELRAMFKSDLAVEVSSCDTNLIDSGTLDSAMFIDLLFCLEDRFGVSPALDDLEVENFSSIKRIAEYIEKSRAAKVAVARPGRLSVVKM